ncbi:MULTISPECIES: alpha/beta hydrolase [Burkholderia]|uniref:Hydrolase n=1 Tax=Burkholderia aenigmatica TaxID=2015348 RepID=A0ABY6XSP6_9BURK|nr:MULTISPECIES: alpha/beta hydrolase [Burkholderia]VWC68031.1 putative hydrolase [Burkholderia aenigmatica]VWC92639.1 putative hydrolase [Burkholderia aenigmatica]
MSNSSHLIAKDQVSAVTESSTVLKLKTKDDIEATRAAVRMFSSKVDDTFFGKRVQVNEDVSVLVYGPSQSAENERLPAIFYIHGGGYVAGAADLYDNEHHEAAAKLHCVVVAVDYRLAPENPYPTPLNDCVSGITWAYDNAEQLGIDRERITVMGESAGGGLTASLCHYLRDKTKITPRNQVMLFPMLDYKTSANPAEVKNKYAGEYVWTHDVNDFGWKYLLGGNKVEDIEIQYYSPSYAPSLENLPRTYIAVGSLDLLLDESLEYARKLSCAGVPISLEVVAGAVHGFNFIPSETARKFNARLSEYLMSVL